MKRRILAPVDTDISRTLRTATMKTVDMEKQIGLVEIGAVSKLTGGSVYFFPWYEVGVPPFVYTCPYC